MIAGLFLLIIVGVVLIAVIAGLKDENETKEAAPPPVSAPKPETETETTIRH